MQAGVSVHRLFDGYNRFMRWLSTVGSLILILGLGALIFTLIPGPVEKEMIPFSTQEGLTGTIEITSPIRLWAGDRAVISMTILVHTPLEGALPLALTGRLEAGIEEVDPRGETQVSIQSDHPFNLAWQVRTAQQAGYSGTLWLHQVSGSNRTLLLAREIRLESRNFLGLRVRRVRLLLGMVSAVGGLVLMSPLFKRQRLVAPGKT